MPSPTLAESDAATGGPASTAAKDLASALAEDSEPAAVASPVPTTTANLVPDAVESLVPVPTEGLASDAVEAPASTTIEDLVSGAVGAPAPTTTEDLAGDTGSGRRHPTATDLVDACERKLFWFPCFLYHVLCLSFFPLHLL